MAQKAAASQTDAAKLNDDNMAKVSSGLMQGATKLSALYANAADPHQDPQAVRAALFQNRHDVAELNAAKTTFSALLDDQGVAIRNDLEQDSMAGQNLFKAFPSLVGAKNGLTTATGVFDLPPPPAPANRDWVAGMPVKKADGSPAGIYITGWTYRQYAAQLQDTLRKRMSDDLEKAHSVAKLPVFYVLLFDDTGVYGTPLTPAVNESKMKDLDLPAKTAAGPVQGTITVDDRDFGYAAARAPSLGGDMGIAVMRSEL
ncbi:MAG: hypothetical protein ACRELY_25900 [Polyangiaceae bacterium]